MFNHNRGLWGYTGAAADGAALSIQSTGMGGPSAAIVLTELSQLGARRFIRVGTCGALDPRLRLGEIVLAAAAIRADGTSRALAGPGRAGPSHAGPDTTLHRALESAGGIRSAVVVSTDLFYGSDEQALLDAGGEVVDMESATLFTLAAEQGVQAASVLIVSDLILPSRRRIEADALKEAERRAGEIAAAALSQQPVRR
jgi:uridine phosphorylase